LFTSVRIKLFLIMKERAFNFVQPSPSQVSQEKSAGEPAGVGYGDTQQIGEQVHIRRDLQT
jgi:hypothetical protein